MIMTHLIDFLFLFGEHGGPGSERVNLRKEAACHKCMVLVEVVRVKVH